MNRMRHTAIFALVTLVPAVLLAAGAALGGVWILSAAVYLTLFMFTLDQFIATTTPDAPDGDEVPTANWLSVILAVLHFGLLACGIWAVSGASGLAAWERAAAFLGFGLFFGQVSNSNAHELIHRPRRALRGLGTWVYISLLFGHHASAHPRVHHRFVATQADPNSARLGESFYRFLPRAWLGSFREGWLAESRLLGKRGARLSSHPYWTYLGGSVLLLALTFAVFGLAGLLSHVALAAYATAQLLLSDYVQHYGLTRGRLPNGSFQPVAMRHSWNSPHWFSSRLMLNAPRHSDHHAHPLRDFPQLRLPSRDDVPMLPLSLPAMATVALFPRAWRRMMDHRARRWQDAAT